MATIRPWDIKDYGRHHSFVDNSIPLIMELKILRKKNLNQFVQTQISELYEQLNPDIHQRPLHQILEDGNQVIVAVCKEEEKVIGIALMATYKVISGHRGTVEDVVVDKSQRGKGIGRQLMEKLLDEAKEQGLDEILLFSGHHRKPAIELYKSLGFTLRNSGLYNLKLS